MASLGSGQVESSDEVTHDLRRGLEEHLRSEAARMDGWSCASVFWPDAFPRLVVEVVADGDGRELDERAKYSGSLLKVAVRLAPEVPPLSECCRVRRSWRGGQCLGRLIGQRVGTLGGRARTHAGSQDGDVHTLC